ncbi:MAG: phosphotransferase family protein [Sphingobium sp.]
MTNAPAGIEKDGRDLFDSAVARVVDRIEPGTQLTTIRRLSGGASQESWLIEGGKDGRPVELVMRRSPGGTTEKREIAVGLPAEARLMTLARAHDVPAPEVLHVLEPDDGLGVGFVMRRVHGETIARKILRDAQFADVRPRLAGLCGDALARISQIPIADCPPLTALPARARLDVMYRDYLAYDVRRPVFEYAYRWLYERMPVEPETLSLVHGDFRNGNLIIDDKGIAAVLDWEMAHAGDPMEDLAWLCVPSWRFGEIRNVAGGFGPVEQLIDGFEAAGGQPVNRASLHFWTVLGALYWGQSCMNFALEFRAGDRTVERASIGRRASETEVDIMMLTRVKDGELV